MLGAALGAVGLLLAGAARAQLRVHDESFKPNYELRVSEADVNINCQKRHSVVVDGQTPGPTLKMKEGQVTWVRVHNEMTDKNLTMHWHGLAQRTAPFSDGTPLVSQWPIPAGHFFDYEIKPEKGDAGTYFYHSHVGFQLLTAHGALIVEDADAQNVADEFGEDLTLLLADHYAATDDEIEAGLLADPFRWSGEPQAVLLGGRSGKFGLDGSAPDPSCEPLVITVKPDQLYRLRVIGATAISLVKLGIEDHPDLRVVEADGGWTKTVRVDHAQVAPGQRFSFSLQSKSYDEIGRSGKTEYWIRFESRERPESITGYALLKYNMSGCDLERNPLPDRSPVQLPAETNNYLEGVLQPREWHMRVGFPKSAEVTRTVTIQINQMLTSGQYVDGKPVGGLVWVQNNETWKEDVQAAANQVPYLISAYQSGTADAGSETLPDLERAKANNGFDPVSRTFPAAVGEVLDIVWQNNAGPGRNFDFHPMHIHGEHAWDMGSGPGLYSPEAAARFDNGFVPARRDTTILHRYRPRGEQYETDGWRAWRVRVTKDNIGAWMMHCHVAQHAVMGMNTVWVFGDAPALIGKFPEAPHASGYLSFGGDAYGTKDRSPEVNHYFE